MTTRTFLLRAQDDLDAKVSPETIAQAKELPGQDQPAQARVIPPESYLSLWPSVLKRTSDDALEKLRAGEATQEQLYMVMGIMNEQMGPSETVRAITEAIDAGVASGSLPAERATEALNAVAHFIRIQEKPEAD